jgi:hypothetical protein
MSRFKSSIRAQLTLFTVVFVMIVAGLAAGTVLSLRSADRKTDELSQKWLAGTAMLGELSDRVSEFRIAEAYRALAADQPAQAEAELLAGEHRNAIEQLESDYVTLLGGKGPSADMDSFRAAWKAYQADHDAWIKADTKGTIDDPARYRSTSHQLYKATDAAVDRLVDGNETAARAQAAAVDQLADRSIVIAIAVCGAAIAFAIWLLFRVRSQITPRWGPLRRLFPSWRPEIAKSAYPN